MRDDQLPAETAGSTTTPPRSPVFDPNRNETPSISPLSTTDKPALPAQIDPIPLQLDHADHTDGSSSLSDYDAEFDDQDQRDNNDRDSEAETERLDGSPVKTWIPSPTKLSQAAAPSEPASSPGPHPQSPSPTHLRLGTYEILYQLYNTDNSCPASPAAIAGRKRKRPSPISDPDSPLSEHSDSEEGLALSHRIHQAPESRQETPEPVDEVDENPYISPMKAARLKRAKQKSKQAREPSPAAQAAATELEEDEVEEQNDDDDEIKKRATEAFTAIVERFQTFRTK